MFQFSESHIEEFQTQGYTVFRAIVPPSLIEELRRECDLGVALAREQHGPNAQRFQPVAKYDINQKPFEEFQQLPAIRDAMARVLTPQHEPAGVDAMGVLVEPQSEAGCTHWHRDWRDNIKGVDLDEWESRYLDNDFFNQVNCALYEDSCTWVVPGSHLRPDTDGEFNRFPTRPIKGPELNGLSGAARERACLDYVQSMPGAQQLFLNVGDYCLYRNSLWHLGNYIPYRKRATLHDGAMTPAFREYASAAPKIAAERIAAGVSWENPNKHRLPVGAQ